MKPYGGKFSPLESSVYTPFGARLMGDISVGRGFAPHVALILRLSLFTRREPMVLISDLMELNSQCQNTDAHASTASTQLARVKSAVSSAPFILLTALLIAVPTMYHRDITVA